MRNALLLLALTAIALAAAPHAAAQEVRGYHVFGDVQLDGSIADGAVLHVTSPNGAIDLRATYHGGEVPTTVGVMTLDDSFNESGTAIPGKLHFYAELPAGRYMLDVTTADGRTAVADVTTSGTQTWDFPGGKYYTQHAGELVLAAPGEAQPVVVGEPAASEPRGYHVNGDVVLHGALVEGLVIRVVSVDGSVDVSAPYEEDVTTDFGTIGILPKHAQDGSIVDGVVHYWFEVPAGAYNVRVESGNMVAHFDVEPSGEGETYAFDHGTYVIQPLEEVEMTEIQTLAPTPVATPSATHGATPTASPSPTATTAAVSPTPAGGAAAPTPDGSTGAKTPGLGLVGVAAALGAALVVLRRRA